jgi:hypothetical protein
MSEFKTEPRLGDPDTVYEHLIDLFDGLDDAGNLRAHARLLLILRNHVGDTKVALAAIDLARRMGPERSL